ncbi:ABC transporter ATP-binding protein [Desulfosporosinus hippei]|uniref:ABC-2 type transport system ATP-binding protein n=1 Tax=Desulfosporosinus hippei DSM 8344 TaxID=1121419 RepID=A0A1G8D0E6_9FIRM|nr:ATP-binding cassette domain-containing protein [Desulfosporosinus hippei]SDH51268.1 ABC-2 type transport system ATP-binding protein [Desulfosporosinus hippei DSM 8344]
MNNTLDVKNINKTYNGVKVINDISFAVKAGEIMGIMGPNGAGKTTTIRMIMGITAPDQGELHFFLNGESRNRIPQASVGYLPEERGLYKEAKVMEILLFLSGLKGLDKVIARKRIMEWLEKFQLADKANSKVQQLSKGMAQKVQFIASVLHQPALVVLDEPFSGLDPVSQDIFKQEIRQLADEGMSILISSHQMNLVEEICNRIFIINKGEKVLYGPLQDIKAQYGSYQVNIIAEQEIPELTQSPLVQSFQRLGKKWSLVLKDNTAPAKFLATIPPGAPIDELSVARISLHDIFVRIAKGGSSDEINLENR